MAKRQPLTAGEESARLILIELAGMRSYSGRGLAAKMGWTQQKLNDKTAGRSVLGINDMKQLGAMLEVDPAIFLFDPTTDAVDGYWFGLTETEFAYLADRVERALARAEAMTEVGAAQLALVLSVFASAVTAWAGVKFPEFAMWAAENQRTDAVMSDSTGRDRPLTLCPAPPTMSAKSVCRPRTHRRPRPDHRLCMRRGSDAAECVDPR